MKKFLAVFTVSLLLTAPAAGQDQPEAEIPEPMPRGGDVNVWLAQNVRYGPEWRSLYHGLSGQEFLERDLSFSQDGRLRFRVRMEALYPRTVRGFEWRSAVGDLETDCEGLRLEGHFTFYAGQNLTGNTGTLDTLENVFGRQTSQYVDNACRIAEALRQDARRNPNEAPGPESADPASLRAWSERTLELDETWEAPILGASIAAAVGREVTTDDEGRSVITLRTEYYGPEEMSGEVARSMVEKIAYDCEWREWDVLETTRYPRRNLRGRAEPVYPVRVLAFDAEPRLSRTLLDKVCGEADPAFVAAATAEPATPGIYPEPVTGRLMMNVVPWVDANVTASDGWSLLGINRNGAVLVRRPIVEDGDEMTVELRNEAGRPVESISGDGRAQATRSWVTTYTVNCRNVGIQERNSAWYDGQNLTGPTVRGSGLITIFNPRQVMTALCDDRELVGSEAEGPSSRDPETVTAWIGSTLRLDGWAEPVNAVGALWMLSTGAAEGTMEVRAEYYQPALSTNADGLTAGPVVRSVRTVYELRCGQGAIPREISRYSRRNLQGRAETGRISSDVDPMPRQILNYYIDRSCGAG